MTSEEIIQKNMQQLTSFYIKNKFRKNDCVVLEKNENSFLVMHAKESTKEFFRNIFAKNGPFWEAYKEMGLGEMPLSQEYVLYINDELYFCKNIEEKYIYSIGPKIIFSYKNGKLSESKKISLDSTLRTLSAPLDIISQTKQIVLDAFKINEIIPKIKTELEESQTYWEKNKNKEDFEIHDAEYALEKAVKCMQYSFFASLAYSLKLKPNEQISQLIEETVKVNKSIISFQKGETPSIDISYFGRNIYDISEQRIFDNTSSTRVYDLPDLPKDYWMLLRETLKIVCARYLAVERKAYLKLGKKLGLEENIFYLSTKEIIELKGKPVDQIVKLIAERKFNYLENSKNSLPNKIIYSQKWFFLEEIVQTNTQEITGLNVGAKKIVKGTAAFVKNDSDLQRDFSGKIIVTSYFSPNLVVTYKSALGVISSVGGALSHPSIVAREKNLPCIVQANLSSIKEGDEIELNGEKGTAKIVKKN
jgi:phosphohistidine swiveling domain-containing protein